ncbi:MAG: DUF1761 domain-containing protein [Nanoarchaeota archaeon]
MAVNLLAVLVAGIAYFIIGGLWYSLLFGKVWMNLMGFTKKDIEKAKQGGMAKKYVINFISALVPGYMLAYILDFLKVSTVGNGVMIGVMVWLGFIATTTLGVVLWEGKPFKLYLLNNGYHLVSLVVMGAILGAWV